MTMNKRDLIIQLAETLEMQQGDVAKIVDTAFATIADSLAEGKRWEFRHFGVFEVKNRLPRKGRNPRTGEAAAVPERKVVAFRPGKRLRERISNGTAHAAEMEPSNGSVRQQTSPSIRSQDSQPGSSVKETTRM